MARRGLFTREQVRKLSDGSPFPRQVTPAPRPSQDVASPYGENLNLSRHKWVTISTGPIPKTEKRQAELASALERQRKEWVIRDGKFHRLSPQERAAVEKELADNREAKELRKSEGDPTRRVEGLMAKTDTGQGDVSRLDRNATPREHGSYGIDVDTGDGVRPLGEREDMSKNRVSYDSVFRQKVWTGSDYRDS